MTDHTPDCPDCPHQVPPDDWLEQLGVPFAAIDWLVERRPSGTWQAVIEQTWDDTYAQPLWACSHSHDWYEAALACVAYELARVLTRLWAAADQRPKSAPVWERDPL